MLAVTASLLLMVAAWSVRAFVVPQQDQPESADAVVVFAGDLPGERINRALQLMDTGVAEVLVISEGSLGWGRGTAVETLCERGSDQFEVICIVPEPDDTIGEATLFAQVAQDNDWDHVIVVTSTAHLTRASLWMGRCFDGEVSRVGVRSKASSRYGHEWLGTLHARLLNRTCPDAHDGRVTAEWDVQPFLEPLQDSPQTPITPGTSVDRSRPEHDEALGQCQDWVGRRFVMTVYSVPIDNPQTRSVADLAREGFTHVGPWYVEDRWESGQAAAELGMCTVFPVGPALSKQEALLDIEATLDQVVADMDAALANPVLNKSISMWSILPEELNTYRRDEAELFFLLTKVVREHDPLGRPVYIYLQSNADELQFELASEETGVLGQGNYLSTNGLHDQRIYLKASILRSIAAREAMGELDDAVMPVVEHRIHSGTLDPGLVPLVESWVRHDLFTSLANGADGFIAFSGFPPKQGQEVFDRYNDAYSTVVAEIVSTRMLDLYALGAVDPGVVATVVEGPQTLSAEVFFIPDRGNPVETFDSFSLRTWDLDGTKTILLVNHADEPISVRLSGFGSSDSGQDLDLRDLLSGDSFVLTDTNGGTTSNPENETVISLPALGVRVLEYRTS